MPMIGRTPAAFACFQKSYAPKTFPWSVMASAGMPIRPASAKRSRSRAAPSSMEYSVCTCRCTNESAMRAPPPSRRTPTTNLDGDRGKAAEPCWRAPEKHGETAAAPLPEPHRNSSRRHRQWRPRRAARASRRRQAEDPLRVPGQEELPGLWVETEPIELGECLDRGDHRIVGAEQHLAPAVPSQVLDEVAGVTRGRVRAGVDVHVG